MAKIFWRAAFSSVFSIAASSRAKADAPVLQFGGRLNPDFTFASFVEGKSNQLARAANTGSLPVTPETEEALLTAVREVSNMRALLIQALDMDVSP